MSFRIQTTLKTQQIVFESLKTKSSQRPLIEMRAQTINGPASRANKQIDALTFGFSAAATEAPSGQFGVRTCKSSID
jgi:hypothetical protein